MARRPRRTMLALWLMLVMVLVISLGVGAVFVPAGEVLRALGWLARMTSEPPDTRAAAIVVELRLPRVLLGAVVGASLAVAGAVYQALFQNPLADPYVVGGASGAAVGAGLAIAGLVAGKWNASVVPMAAFLGAFAAVLIAHRLAKVGGRTSAVGLLLAGVALAAVLSAGLQLLIATGGPRLAREITLWLIGGLAGRTWPQLLLATVPGVLGLALAFVQARELDVLAQGDEPAASLGLDVERRRLALLAVGALLTAAAVSASGVIGFVGLVVPHVVRRLFGPGHARLLRASAVLGASLLVLADSVGRLVARPGELPVGVLTAVLGGPFFLWLLRQHWNRV